MEAELSGEPDPQNMLACLQGLPQQVLEQQLAAGA